MFSLWADKYKEATIKIALNKDISFYNICMSVYYEDEISCVSKIRISIKTYGAGYAQKWIINISYK